MPRIASICSAALVGIALMVGGKPPLAEEQDASKLQPLTLVLATPSHSISTAYYSSLPLYLGYWKEEGIDVSIIPSSGSTAAIQQLVAGNAQMVTSGSSSVMAFADRAPNLRLVNMYLPKNFYELVVPAGSPIDSIEDLKGKKLGVQSLAGATYYYYKAVMQNAGLTPDKDVQFIPIGVGNTAAEALRSGVVDAFGGYDGPNADIENLGVELRRIKTPLDDAFAGVAGVATTSDFIKENRDAVIGLNRGIAKATLFAESNPEAAVRIHWQVYPDSKPTAEAEDEALRKGVHALQRRLENSGQNPENGFYGSVDVNGMQRQADFYFETEQIPQKVDVRKITDFSLLEDINDFDHDAIVKQAEEFNLQ